MRRSMALAATLMLSAQPLLAAPAPVSPFLFSRPALAPTVSPRAAELADIDGDGRTDLIAAVGSTCCPTSIGISVMRSRPDGFFHPATVAETGSLPDDVQLVDIDGNGALDAIAAVRIDDAQPDAYRAVALQGNGDGSFGAALDLPFPTFVSMAAGRLGPGGSVAAVVATDNGLGVWEARGGFSFAKTGTLSAGPASELLAGDLEGDGQDELLAYGNGTLALYRGTTQAGSVTLPDVVGLRLADMAGGPGMEILATQSGGSVQILGPDLATIRSVSTVGSGVQATGGNLDGDALTDLVRANTDPSVTVFFGKGGAPLRVPLAQVPTDVFLRDATGDGNTDILALETAPSVVEIVDGDGSGGFPGVRPVRATSPGHWQIEKGDFNNDGKPDLVSTALYPFFDGLLAGFRARVALGDGNGGLAQKTVLEVDGAVSGLGVADVNGDGKQDVIVSEYYAATSYFLGNGDGTFGPRVPFASCYFNDGLVTGDFNEDGYGDVASICNSVIFRTTLSVALGSPGGLVRAPALPLANANQTFVLRTGDVNGDGNQDIALAGFDYFNSPAACQPDINCLLQRSDGPVTYLLGLGNGVFEPVTKGAPVGARLYDLALADLNGDGRDDLVTTMVFEDRVMIQPGNADGTVGAPISIPTYDYPTIVEAADVTGDGLKDLLITHGPGIMSIHASTGSFDFAPPTAYASRASFGEIVLGNYAGDGRTDVLAGTSTGVEVYTNGA